MTLYVVPKPELEAARTEEERLLLNDLRILAERIKMVGTRYGLNPIPAIFTLKSDQQVLDDIVYAGLPRHYRHWRYGKRAMQPRNGHVFEFALNAEPAEIALGSTNSLIMQLAVMAHAWMGHAEMDKNAWFRETGPRSIIQRFAQDERFVDQLIEQWGFDRYEYYMDAIQALEGHSGWLPTNYDILPDSQHRRMLEASLPELQAEHDMAQTDADRRHYEEQIRETLRLLTCHPIVPTDDLLGFLGTEENTPHLPWEAHHLIAIVRAEQLYHQAFMRTRYAHEGFSHWVDSHFPWEPEIDLPGLGFEAMYEMAQIDTMHDRMPMDWFHDVYAFGMHLMDYIDKTTSVKTGTEVVRFRRLQRGDDGHIIETDVWVEKEVDKYDRTRLYEVKNSFNDRRIFETFITEDSMAILNDKALEWVRRQMQQINKLLIERGWNRQLVFDPLPDTLEEMSYAIEVWFNQRQMAGFIGQSYGYGAPAFPFHEYMLNQMLQVIQTVAEWDADKDGFKQQMLLYTDLSFAPSIRLVDSGRFNDTGMHTLRHDYDPNFGPLAQNDARETVRRYWRLGGPVQLLTWELLTDDFGRPVGAPRPYRYYTENGQTVKEQWL